jgi:hypothetical protein
VVEWYLNPFGVSQYFDASAIDFDEGGDYNHYCVFVNY